MTFPHVLTVVVDVPKLSGVYADKSGKLWNVEKHDGGHFRLVNQNDNTFACDGYIIRDAMKNIFVAYFMFNQYSIVRVETSDLSMFYLSNGDIFRRTTPMTDSTIPQCTITPSGEYPPIIRPPPINQEYTQQNVSQVVSSPISQQYTQQNAPQVAPSYNQSISPPTYSVKPEPTYAANVSNLFPYPTSNSNTPYNMQPVQPINSNIYTPPPNYGYNQAVYNVSPPQPVIKTPPLIRNFKIGGPDSGKTIWKVWAGKVVSTLIHQIPNSLVKRRS